MGTQTFGMADFACGKGLFTSSSEYDELEGGHLLERGHLGIPQHRINLSLPLLYEASAAQF